MPTNLKIIGYQVRNNDDEIWGRRGVDEYLKEEEAIADLVQSSKLGDGSHCIRAIVWKEDYEDNPIESELSLNNHIAKSLKPATHLSQNAGHTFYTITRIDADRMVHGCRTTNKSCVWVQVNDQEMGYSMKELLKLYETGDLQLKEERLLINNQAGAKYIADRRY
ncbi:hypothetical protein F7U66_01160 [Vibrio parahaemolyticus]|nr:hypothetical protein [Vibrio parahaemolyticus]